MVIPFRGYVALRVKNGSVTFEHLWIPNFIPNFERFLGAVSKISRNGRTDGRTNETDFIDPLVFNQGPIGRT